MSDVVMPRLSDSMEEGTIIKWLVDDGAEVKRGDELVEIETDKATMTYEADADGPVEIVAAEGDTLPIGEVIARIGGGGGGGSDNGSSTDAGAATPATTADDPGEAESSESAQAQPAVEAPAAEQPQAEPAPANGDTQEAGSASPAPSTPSGDGGERVKASPVARRMARELGVELGGLTGSGPGGRIVKADVEKAHEDGPPAAAPAAAEPAAAPASAPAPAPLAGQVTETGTAKGDVEVVELSRTQALIARRMAESKATVPEFVLNMRINMSACIDGRATLKAAAKEGDVVPSFNDMVVKACALALREFPRANGAYKDGKWELYSRVNVGIAVAAPGSLVVPTIFDADVKGLRQIATDARALAGKVRDSSITPPELSGGTFTVSNLGMYGITSFQAVINPPQAGILAVGAIDADQHMMVTLACDHRILYGADGAEFLARVCDLLQSPLGLAL